MRIWPLPLKGEVTLHFLELASQRAQRGTLTVPAPPALRWTPHKPSRSPALPLCMDGVEGVEGGQHGRQAEWAEVGRLSARQARLGRHDPETDFGMILLPTPHHHQTGSATRSGGCHAIAQKGVAKAFCCAGSMMTADGGWERLLWRVACTPGNAPFRGLPTTAPSSMVKQSSGEWGAERTRDRAFSLGFGP
jgi:hypothetical protein